MGKERSIKTITQYRTSDGTNHNTWDEAVSHNKKLSAWDALGKEWWDQCCDCYDHFIDFIEEHSELVKEVLRLK